MNTDRFLTRVWDKQEKKMLYLGDDFKENSNSTYKEHTFYGATTSGLIVERIFRDEKGWSWTQDTVIIPFGDRFVPMQCKGSIDKNKKLIYESDICADNNNNIFVMKYGYGMLSFRPIVYQNNLITPYEILGNIYEDAHLLDRGNNVSKNTKTN